MRKLSVWLSALLFGAVASVAVAATSPMSVPGATTVSAAEAKALFDKGVVFVDLRSDKDWQAGRIPDAVHLELKSAFNEAALAGLVQKGDPVVLYCNGESCLRSSEASVEAVKWGFTKVHYFRDGLPGWKAANYPVE
jgi:rhodanese-related sulfurtransferase